MRRIFAIAAVLSLLAVVKLSLSDAPISSAAQTEAQPSVGEDSHARVAASVNAPVESPKDQKPLMTEVSSLLKDGFHAAELASDGERGPLDAYLARLDREPELARKMITEGLSTLPKDQGAAMQRAGLLDLVPRFASGQEAWAVQTLETELVSYPSEARILQSAARNREEMNAALTVTPDILRTHLAFENLIGVLKRDCAQLASVSSRVLASQKDEILRSNFKTRIQFECPSVQVSSLTPKDLQDDQGAAQ